MSKVGSAMFALLLLACSSSPRVDSATAVTATAYDIQRAPVRENSYMTKIAFGSCQNQKAEQKVFTAVLEKKPDLYISMGDNVYTSRPEDRPISEAYRLQSKNTDFKKLWEMAPIIATWDDHDYGSNDGGKENPDKQEALREYLAFFPDDAAKIPKDQDGIYHSFTFGFGSDRVMVILLDTRWNRDSLEPQLNPKSPLDKYQATENSSKTLLGDKQWKWLEDQLKKPAEIKLLVSSIQVLPNEHGFEKWGNFPHERDRLLKMITKIKPKNFYILSGDRHLAEISTLQLPGYGKLTEITASSINRLSNILEEKNSLREGNFYTRENFGLLSIDWSKQTLQFEIRNIEGELVQSHRSWIER